MNPSWPISRVLSKTVIYLGSMSPSTSCSLPKSQCGSHLRCHQRADFYLALLQLGFTSPLNVTTSAVRSYRTLSPLPRSLITKALKSYGAVYFLLHLPWAYAPQVLPGNLTLGARTFLHFAASRPQLPCEHKQQ